MANSESWTEVSEKMVCDSPECTAGLTIYLEEWEINPVCRWWEIACIQTRSLQSSWFRAHLSICEYGVTPGPEELLFLPRHHRGSPLFVNQVYAYPPACWQPAKPKFNSIPLVPLTFSDLRSSRRTAKLSLWEQILSTESRLHRGLWIVMIHSLQQSEEKDWAVQSNAPFTAHQWRSSVSEETGSLQLCFQGGRLACGKPRGTCGRWSFEEK